MNHVYGGGADSVKQYGDCSLAESELQELLVCVCRWGFLPSSSRSDSLLSVFNQKMCRKIVSKRSFASNKKYFSLNIQCSLNMM